MKAGSGRATFGVPDSAGVPASLAQHTYTLAYNDHEGLRRLFEEKGDQLACVIVEPVTGNMGVIEPTTAFRDAMMEVTLAYESVLIFDEVMTGSRRHRGAQGLYGMTPDLTCLGKVVGGGLPVGVYGGRKDLWSRSLGSGLSGRYFERKSSGDCCRHGYPRPAQVHRAFAKAEAAATALANGASTAVR